MFLENDVDTALESKITPFISGVSVRGRTYYHVLLLFFKWLWDPSSSFFGFLGFIIFNFSVGGFEGKNKKNIKCKFEGKLKLWSGGAGGFDLGGNTVSILLK